MNDEERIEPEGSEALGEAEPSQDDSAPESILCRRSRITGMYVRLWPKDHQLYFAFVAKR